MAQSSCGNPVQQMVHPAPQPLSKPAVFIVSLTDVYVSKYPSTFCPTVTELASKPTTTSRRDTQSKNLKSGGDVPAGLAKLLDETINLSSPVQLTVIQRKEVCTPHCATNINRNTVDKTGTARLFQW